MDTSVIVAIVAREPEREAFLEILASEAPKFTSPLVIFEATMVLASRLDVEPLEAFDHVSNLIASGDVDVQPLEARHARIAVQAFATYGKGRGHPAQLNLADCLSYACAKAGSAPLLYKGEDFGRTDLA